LAEAYLFISINKFSLSTRKQNLSMKKVYTIDTGIYNSAGFKFSDQYGKIMENIVAIKLLRDLSSDSIYYWKDYQNREVDFAIKINNEIEELIQVTYSSSYQEIEKREFENLIRAGKELKCSNLKIITWDYENVRMYGDYEINFTPLWKYLLE
jgi:hypothetical protein